MKVKMTLDKEAASKREKEQADENKKQEELKKQQKKEADASAKEITKKSPVKESAKAKEETKANGKKWFKFKTIKFMEVFHVRRNSCQLNCGWNTELALEASAPGIQVASVCQH